MSLQNVRGLGLSQHEGEENLINKRSHCKLKTVLSVDTCSYAMRITVLNRITNLTITSAER